MKYTVVGLMSGTSLDGLDMACCEFGKEKGKWKFKVLATETLSYENKWLNLLQESYQKDNKDLDKIDKSYAELLANATLGFIKQNQLKPDFVASHGHTVFHQPQKGFTKQIGNGNTMASILKVPVVFDFRSLDVSMGGQGAPLVPIGDKWLFSDYDFCLNLGGFANVSFEVDGIRFAYDICPVNMILNYLSQLSGNKYDKSGRMAASGQINDKLLKLLNNISFYQQKPPKSLSREWFELEFLPIVKGHQISNQNLLRTVTEHIATQISNVFNSTQASKVLMTGGGTYNSFLVKRIRALSRAKMVIPQPEIIDFKEAIIFAFLGILRMRNEVNCLCSVTGASKDCSGGQIAMP